jgi:putative membrane protein
MPYWACTGAGFGLWWIFPLFFGGLWLLLLLGFLIWRFGGWGRRGWSDAASVLRERFARGDIDADEYEKRRRVLEGRS